MEWDELKKNERLELISHYSRLLKMHSDQVGMTKKELENIQVHSRYFSTVIALHENSIAMIKIQLARLGVKNQEGEGD